MKTTYELSEISEVTGANISAIRNWIHREMLQNPGREPRAGHAREIPLLGVYEIMILQELTDSGFTLEFARELVKESLRKEAIWEHRDLENPALLVFAGHPNGRGGLGVLGPDYAHGFDARPDGLLEVAKQFVATARPYLLQSKPRGTNEPNRMGEGPKQTVFGVLNLTEILVRLDRQLSQ